ncbi:UPF0149 family protein [Solidesulfovibrio magneticus]|uniref:Uncharacterized protein n=1 Tax=Solidesulfovibrio magneticus (strain ATCC 700980 / DSM 13731 / RS-1) TaxID=573370 RepID=C4XM64_SOLM1|nr:UPF0149 family protein [Solidesulfovibrio magneticus]BAH77192.1 hypothetical protein DMR_37010 [Solidesulfovibrio magneticus RS-1]
MFGDKDVPLFPDEIDDFRSYLLNSPGAMRLEEVEGFFAAIICSPEVENPVTIFAPVLGFQSGESVEDFKKYLPYAVRHLRFNRLCIGDCRYSPMVFSHEEYYNNSQLYGYDWALGFIEGIRLHKDAWLPFWESHRFNKFQNLLYRLAAPLDQYPPVVLKSMTLNVRKKWFSEVKQTIPIVFRLFADVRTQNVEEYKRKSW